MLLARNTIGCVPVEFTRTLLSCTRRSYSTSPLTFSAVEGGITK